MALSDDIDDIKTNIGRMAFAIAATEVAIQHLSDKIDGIKSNGNKNSLPMTVIFRELTHLFKLLAAGDKTGAAVIVHRLTGCTGNEAQAMVEDIDVTNSD